LNNLKFRRGLEPDFVSYEHLKGRLDSEALLEDLGIDIGFRQRAGQLMCHCPDMEGNHSNGDSSASFGFNEDKLVFNCFVCGGGNVIELVQMMKPEFAPRPDVVAVSTSGRDIERDEAAVRYLEQFADLNATGNLTTKLQSILHPQDEEETMPDYPPENIFQYRKIHPYLYERGLTRDVIVEMEIGFDDEHAGITIPHWFMGKLVGLQRRHLAQDAQGNFMCPRCYDSEKPHKKIPKYKNTSRFPKVNTLYGYDKMKQYVASEGRSSAIVVESPMSVLNLKTLGFHRTVGSFGQFSKEQGMLLLGLECIYYWPDNGPAGVVLPPMPNQKLQSSKRGSFLYENARLAADTLGRMTTLKIVPLIDGPKADPGDLRDPLVVQKYLQNAWNSNLWELYAKEGLPTLEQVIATNNIHRRWH
jgi:hypothetical protein